MVKLDDLNLGLNLGFYPDLKKHISASVFLVKGTMQKDSEIFIGF